MAPGSRSCRSATSRQRTVAWHDISVIVGFPVARQLFGYDGHPSRIDVRKVTSQMLAPAGIVEHCELGWRAARLN